MDLSDREGSRHGGDLHASAAELPGLHQAGIPRQRFTSPSPTPPPLRSHSAALSDSHRATISPDTSQRGPNRSVHGAGWFKPGRSTSQAADGLMQQLTEQGSVLEPGSPKLHELPNTSLYAPSAAKDPDNNPSVHMLPRNGNSSHHVQSKVGAAADPAGGSIRYGLHGSQHHAPAPDWATLPEAEHRLSNGSGRVVVVDTLQPGLMQDKLGHGRSTRAWIVAYFKKWQGVSGEKPAPRDSLNHIAWGWLGSFISILSICLINSYLSPNINLPVLVASFGASAVLLFGVPEAKLSQPRNFLGGHIVSVLVGVSVRNIFSDALAWLSAALGMSVALAAMQFTQTTHPPGGATALIAASAVSIGPWRGFKFVLTVLFGSGVMLVVALVVNNLADRRRYPMFWF